jgi:selenide, water dikinase
MKIDFKKRREVMERSMRLGHCICEPSRPCPCDVFTDQGICPCAGERPDPADIAEVKLTRMVRNPGCASKIPAADLDQILSRLPAVNDPRVISGLAAGDDAAIYRIAEDLCLVQTVDVFSPCVDDPHLFGRICAANCLSDIYAMGGDPRTALSILGFPSDTLPGEIIHQMLQGAMQTFSEAGVALVGGHSIKDHEVKLGFAITGTIDPAIAASLDAPQAGDLLVLTKPLGTGILGFAQQIERAQPSALAAAAASMAQLNKPAADSMREAGASACTDITGFGLFAHLYRMLRTRSLQAVIHPENLPVLPDVLELLREEVIPGAVERNREFAGAHVTAVEGVDRAYINLGFDAQTSGGLLIAIAPGRLQALQNALASRGVLCALIGELRAGPTLITLTPCSAPVAEAPAPTVQPVEDPNLPVHAPDEPCCADVFSSAPASGTALETQRAFGALMRSVQDPGSIDARTKELILFSLVCLARCEECFETHYHRALELGITPAELDEAAWCAAAMGGAPVKVFYQTCRNAVK